jgi:DNA (cytosine-5)-methyltransferase 1
MAEAYYNEHDPKAAATLRELIRGGHIAPGVVDERSIEDVSPAELVRFTQCHFFAGFGVWSYALRRAGWPDDRPIWTGSCPCQPFSAAGKGDGFADERHLWPAFYHLIRECDPECVTGEQVASKDADTWIDLVQADLEALEYAFGAIPFPAAGVGAPEIRDRLYWVAHANNAKRRANRARRHHGNRQNAGRPQGASDAQGRGELGRLGNAASAGLEGYGRHGNVQHGPGRIEPHTTGPVAAAGVIGGMANDQSQRCGEERPIGTGQHGRDSAQRITAGLESGGLPGRLADTESIRQQGLSLRAAIGLPQNGTAQDSITGRLADTDGRNAGAEREQCSGQQRQQPENGGHSPVGSDVPGPTNGHWRAADWILCRDPDGPRWRPVEPGTFPLAHGAPERMGRLRGYGNAIVAQAAEEFIKAVMEATFESEAA